MAQMYCAWDYCIASLIFKLCTVMRCLPLSCSAPLARLPWRCWRTNRLIPRKAGRQPRLGATERGFSVFSTKPCPVFSNLGQITVGAPV